MIREAAFDGHYGDVDVDHTSPRSIVPCEIKESFMAEAASARETLPDSIFRILCAMNGLSTRRPCSIWGKVLPLGVWTATFLVWIHWVYSLLYRLHSRRRDELSLPQEFFVLNRIIYSINCQYWGLYLILRSTAFEPFLQKRGRRFRDIAVPVLFASSYQILYVVRIMLMKGWLSRCHAMTHFSLVSSMMTFFLVYEDAINRILKIHADLNVSTRATMWLDVTRIISRKMSIRRTIEQINQRFAIPLALHYSLTISLLLRVFFQLVENRTPLLEKVLVIVGHGFMLVLFYSVARKGSKLASKSLELESLVLTRYSSSNTRHQTLVRRALRSREEWDVLLVGTFSLSVPNWLKFLTFCITCVAAVLQYDFEVVGTLNGLGKTFGTSRANGQT